MEKKMITMTIHQGLSERKKLKNKIEREINNAKFVGTKKGSSNTVYDTDLTEEEYKVQASSTLQSIEDLIKRDGNIKRAIILSNATTKVVIGGIEMTVAEAIEKKAAITLKKSLLNSLRNQSVRAQRRVNERNEEVDSMVARQLETFNGGKNGNAKTDDIKTMEKMWREQFSWGVVDFGVSDVIAKLTKEIEDFEAEVDAKLSESNAVTKIEIEE